MVLVRINESEQKRIPKNPDYMGSAADVMGRMGFLTSLVRSFSWKTWDQFVLLSVFIRSWYCWSSVQAVLPKMWRCFDDL